MTEGNSCNFNSKKKITNGKGCRNLQIFFYDKGEIHVIIDFFKIKYLTQRIFFMVYVDNIYSLEKYNQQLSSFETFRIHKFTTQKTLLINIIHYCYTSELYKHVGLKKFFFKITYLIIEFFFLSR